MMKTLSIIPKITVANNHKIKFFADYFVSAGFGVFSIGILHLIDLTVNSPPADRTMSYLFTRNDVNAAATNACA